MLTQLDLHLASSIGMYGLVFFPVTGATSSKRNRTFWTTAQRSHGLSVSDETHECSQYRIAKRNSLFAFITQIVYLYFKAERHRLYKRGRLDTFSTLDRLKPRFMQIEPFPLITIPSAVEHFVRIIVAILATPHFAYGVPEGHDGVRCDRSEGTSLLYI